MFVVRYHYIGLVVIRWLCSVKYFQLVIRAVDLATLLIKLDGKVGECQLNLLAFWDGDDFSFLMVVWVLCRVVG